MVRRNAVCGIKRYALPVYAKDEEMFANRMKYKYLLDTNCTRIFVTCVALMSGV